MGTCSAKGCSKTCPDGCGCIYNATKKKCSCWCANSNGELEPAEPDHMPEGAEWDRGKANWSPNDQVVPCLKGLPASAVAALFVKRFGGRLTAEAPDGEITLERQEMTLRELAALAGVDLA